MKYQALFSSKYKSKQIKCGLLQFLFGALRVNVRFEVHPVYKCQSFDFGGDLPSLLIVIFYILL